MKLLDPIMSKYNMDIFRQITMCGGDNLTQDPRYRQYCSNCRSFILARLEKLVVSYIEQQPDLSPLKQEGHHKSLNYYETVRALVLTQKKNHFFNCDETIVKNDTTIVVKAFNKQYGVAVAVKLLKRDYYDLINEYMIGYYGTNRLKALIPNFCYYYHIAPKNNYEQKTKKYYLVSEYVDGLTLSQAISQNLLFEEDYIAIYLQVVCSLMLANRLLNFTHYDLHKSNIIITILPTAIHLPVYYGEQFKCLILKTRVVAYIIDCGRSYCRSLIDGRVTDIGHNGYLEIGIYGYRSHIAYDLFKITAILYHETKKRTKLHTYFKTIIYILFGMEIDKLEEKAYKELLGNQFPLFHYGRVKNPDSRIINITSLFYSFEFNKIVIATNHSFKQHILASIGMSTEDYERVRQPTITERYFDAVFQETIR